MDVDGVIDAIGPRLRALRRERRLTLTELGARTGLSVSTLSRVETGHRQPTLDILLPLAAAYQVALERIIGAPATGDPRMHLEPHSHAGGGVIVPLTRYPSRIQVFKHVLGPREPRLKSHEGHAWLYILAGTLHLIVGDDSFEIGPGETAEFDAAEPHWFGPVDDTAVEILHMFGPYGDRVTARADPAAGR